MCLVHRHTRNQHFPNVWRYQLMIQGGAASDDFVFATVLFALADSDDTSVLPRSAAGIANYSTSKNFSCEAQENSLCNYVQLNLKWRPKAIETTLPQAILSRTARALGLIAEEPFRIWHTEAAILSIQTSVLTLGTQEKR